jgi:hypothetical protein
MKTKTEDQGEECKDYWSMYRVPSKVYFEELKKF